MKKIFLFIIMAFLLMGCEPTPINPEADCEEAELCFIVNEWFASTNSKSVTNYQSLFGVRSDALGVYKKEEINPIESRDSTGLLLHFQKKVYFDVSIHNNKRYLAGAMREYVVKNQDSVFKTNPFVEIDGKIHYINVPINPNTGESYYLTPLRMFWENGDLYVILVTGVDDDGKDCGVSNNVLFYESVNMGTPRYIMTGQRDFGLLNIRKCGNKYCLVGARDLLFKEEPAIQWEGEGVVVLLPNMYKGIVYDVCVKDNDELVVGWIQDSIRRSRAVVIENGGTKKFLPVYSENSQYSKATCCALRGDDLWVGGCIDNSPTIWKNGELVSAEMDYSDECTITDFCFCKNAIYTTALIRDSHTYIFAPVGIKWVIGDDGIWHGQEIYNFRNVSSTLRFSSIEHTIYTMDFSCYYTNSLLRNNPFPQRFYPVK